MPTAAPARSQLERRRGAHIRRQARALARSPLFVVGAAVVAFWIAMGCFWPLVVPRDPQALDLAATLHGPSAAHWFGTDNLGRDVFARVLAGARPVLMIAPAAMLLGVGIGSLLGLCAAYLRGIFDDVVMRTGELILAFPWIVIAIALLSVIGHSILTVVAIVGAVFIAPVARTVRAAALVQCEMEYVQAATLRGESALFILVREVLPNVQGVILVEATARLGIAVFAAATLSFLSLGVQPPSPDWALTIAEGRVYLQVAPWIVLFPAGALASLIVAVNLASTQVREVRQRWT